jgi:hypothetical protein
LRIAAAPATCGVAIEVPDSIVYESSTGVPSDVPAARAAMMSTPGAVMSGLIAKSPVRGPRPENPARTSDLSTAPTVSAWLAAPGLVTVSRPDPKFPAAIVKSTPFAR